MTSATAPRESAPDVQKSRDESRFLLWAGGVAVLTAILFFVRLGARALWSSEFRWAEIAREMLLTHNYFWPTINGHVYYDKPLGSYWLVVMGAPLTGGLNEAATRLPCALAGLAAVVILMLWVRRLYDDARTAVLAGFILATSFSFVFFSRHASADVETITGELAALFLFHRNQDRAGGLWVIGLWLVMAGAPPTQGQQRNRWFFNLYTIAGVLVAVAVYEAPFEISSRMMGSEKGLRMVFRENVVRFFEPFDHRGPIY